MKVLEVSIYGNKYRIRSDFDEFFLEEAAKMVENRMKEIEETYRILTTSKVAIMAAFDIATEYLKVKRDLDFLENRLSEIEKKLEIVEGV
ncbi:cell division protein ZapA [Deferribacter thermophilus]|uniref:cell division protein ZapA n=1 Tax=Deferribacter thermophilus TaxID=53573 RepID=UPI003C176958